LEAKGNPWLKERLVRLIIGLKIFHFPHLRAGSKKGGLFKGINPKGFPKGKLKIPFQKTRDLNFRAGRF